MGVFVAGFLHLSRGNKTAAYGPALCEQIRVVKTMDAVDRSSIIRVDVPFYAASPELLQTLIELYCTVPAAALPRQHLTIRYADDRQYSGRLSVEVRGAEP
jgi:hypothetical protein